MKTIKDSVHDHIEIDGVALELLDTPPVQRLRRIKQLGTVELVYPSANHTRFEHSLGVYKLACDAISKLNIRGDAARHLRAAALLHDIGHTPYSHNIEPIVTRKTGEYHDDVTSILSSPEITPVLEDNDLDPQRIAGLISGEGQYGQLLAGDLDVDRMDYLVRDAHHTGVPFGTIDHGRLIRELTFIDGQLVLAEGNVQTAESLLIARALMNPTVYNHHVARISKAMLRRSTERLLDLDVITASELRRMDDYDLHAALRRTNQTRTMARRIANRELYKRAVWIGKESVPNSVISASRDKIQEWENEIAETTRISDEQIILDVPPEPVMTESTTHVEVAGDTYQLEEQSPLVEAVRAALHTQWRLGVYTTQELVEPVGKAAAECLELDTDENLVNSQKGQYIPLEDFSTES